MEKRIFAAIVVSVAVLYLWGHFAPKLFPDLAKPEPVATSTAKTPAVKTATQTAAPVKVPGVTPATIAPVVPIVPASASEQIVTDVKTDEYTARFSNRGAQLISFKLAKYFDKEKQQVELVRARAAASTDYPFAIETQNAALASRLNTALYAVNVVQDPQKGVRSIEYRYAADGVSVTKTFRFGTQYMFDFSVAVAPAVPYRIINGPGIRTLTPDEYTSKLVVSNGVVQREGSLDIVPRDKGDRVRIYDQTDFVGLEDNYFLSVFRPAKSGGAVVRRLEIHHGKEVQRELYAALNAAPDGVITGNAFFGPKQTKLLDRYGFASTLQFGYFGIIARFLLEVLVWINQATKNYGWAIIVLTILIKVVLYPLQHKSIVSMKKMQRLQPKMEAIKNRYKKAKTDPDQRQKMNVEMMKLYQVEGINPMSGCFPILLQLPILWGFYGLLSRAIELRGAPWILWIQDLSDKDPYYITPLLMTITMFVQTWITPTTGDPSQRKIFLFMPFVFGFIFKDMPSGLVLYWLVQNILTIVQQMIMNKWWKDHPAELQTA